MIIVIVMIVVIAIATICLAVSNHRYIERKYKEMETMTPRDAYRRRLVLQYLPQCQLDMDAINAMVDQAYPETTQDGG